MFRVLGQRHISTGNTGFMTRLLPSIKAGLNESDHKKKGGERKTVEGRL